MWKRTIAGMLAVGLINLGTPSGLLAEGEKVSGKDPSIIGDVVPLKDAEAGPKTLQEWKDAVKNVEEARGAQQPTKPPPVVVQPLPEGIITGIPPEFKLPGDSREGISPIFLPDRPLPEGRPLPRPGLQFPGSLPKELVPRVIVIGPDGNDVRVGYGDPAGGGDPRGRIRLVGPPPVGDTGTGGKPRVIERPQPKQPPTTVEHPPVNNVPRGRGIVGPIFNLLPFFTLLLEAKMQQLEKEKYRREHPLPDKSYPYHPKHNPGGHI